ncbi:hypothetical protein K7X08_002758 [Anisodus acutangulus]|uniref:Uncharacterized protein n=1 Tax=Anisodus acutangulus TaxID=402998 RepID=A0A9Q1MFS0_9SOLA|nr:hypothetical protein K7X08_002758 [Anisodus acutangulus]
MRNSIFATVGLAEGEIETEDRENLVWRNVSIKTSEEGERVEQYLEVKEAYGSRAESDSSAEKISNLDSSWNVVDQPGSDSNEMLIVELTNIRVKNMLKRNFEKLFQCQKKREKRNMEPQH